MLFTHTVIFTDMILMDTVPIHCIVGNYNKLVISFKKIS